jgi:transposase
MNTENMKKHYTDEFKKQAVELAESIGSTIGAARQLGISDASIHSWKTRFSQQKPVLNESEAAELKRLKKENAELKKVNHILKSAAAFFSQDHLK